MQTKLVGSWGLVATVAVVVSAAVVLSKRRPVFAPVMILALAGYCSSTILSTWLAPDAGGVRRLVVSLSCGLAVYAMASCCSAFERLFVIRALVALSVVESYLGLTEILGWLSPVWGYDRIGWNGLERPYESELFEGQIRATGTLGHPLLLAFLMVVSIALIVGVRPFKSSLITGFCVASCFMGIVVASSRSGILIAAVLLAFSARSVVTRLWVGCVFGIVLAVLFKFGDLASIPALQRFGSSNSVAHRSSSVGALGSLLQDQGFVPTVLGNGFISARRLYENGTLPYAGGFYAIDNQFVSILVVSGLIGLACVVALFGWCLLRGGGPYRWSVGAILAQFFTFEVLMWPSSLAITLVILVFAGLSASRGRTVRARHSSAGLAESGLSSVQRAVFLNRDVRS